MYQTEKSSWWKHWDFIVLDIICLQIAYVISFMIRHGWIFPYKLEAYKDLGVILALIELCAGFFLESYKDVIRRGYFEEAKRVVLQITVVLGIVIASLFMTKSSEVFSRAVFLRLWILAIMITYMGRVLLKLWVRKVLRNKEKLQKLILVSTGREVKTTIEELEKQKYKNYYISGIILLEKTDIEKILGIPVISCGEDAILGIQNSIVDEVFLDCSTRNPLVKRILSACREMGLTTHYNLGNNDMLSETSMVENFGGFAVLTSSIKFADSRQLFLKRLMDIAGGIIGMILTGILTIILAPIIYIRSPGPVFFSQERVGRNGRKFKIYKFRSMYPDAEERKKELMEKNKMQGLMFKMDDDPRIIPIGKFIRKTSLDEFPQFFNVLKGDMSLVGTRPPTVDEYEQYETHHRVRLAAKPGLTGMWQVSGRSDIVDFEEVVALDKKYIEEWNIGLDIRILLETVKVVLTGKGSV